MTDRQKKLIRRAALTAAALGLLIPVTVSPTQGVQQNQACAGEGCCRELNSTCVGEGVILHHYNSTDPKCQAVKAD